MFTRAFFGYMYKAYGLLLIMCSINLILTYMKTGGVTFCYRSLVYNRGVTVYGAMSLFHHSCIMTLFHPSYACMSIGLFHLSCKTSIAKTHIESPTSSIDLKNLINVWGHIDKLRDIRDKTGPETCKVCKR